MTVRIADAYCQQKMAGVHPPTPWPPIISQSKTFIMDLIIYDQPGRSINTTPEIAFNETGVIWMNRILAQELDVKHGDCIAFAQDPKDRENWYVYKAKKGFRVRANKSGSFVTNSAEVCKLLFKQFPTDREAYATSKRLKMKIGSEAVKQNGLKLLPIITAPLAKKANEKRLAALTS